MVVSPKRRRDSRLYYRSASYSDRMVFPTWPAKVLPCRVEAGHSERKRFSKQKSDHKSVLRMLRVGLWALARSCCTWKPNSVPFLSRTILFCVLQSMNLLALKTLLGDLILASVFTTGAHKYRLSDELRRACHMPATTPALNFAGLGIARDNQARSNLPR